MDKRKIIIAILQAAVLLNIVTVEGYGHYRDRIPNGRQMAHPCKVNYMWYGVGHTNPQGGGARNKFGEDFQRFGHTWNACLCQEDSDGDGFSNGFELGDPDCVWTPGQTPHRIADITHPGICEPLDDPNCQEKNTFLDCEIDTEFNCDAINNPDTEQVTLRFEDTPVPTEVTSYMCQAFTLPADVDYHMIALQPYIVNREVTHHITLSACSEEQTAEVFDKWGTPAPCGMGPCDSGIIEGWTLGSNGLCYDEKYGRRFGRSGPQTVVMQIHWNNIEMKSDLIDSSGLTLFYTRNLRMYDLNMLIINTQALQIPPGQLNYVEHAQCSSSCTSRMFNESIFMITLSPHMHYLGTSLKVTHHRDGNLIDEYEVPRFMYDNPEPLSFDPPVEVKPGDELNLYCTFDSMTRATFTYFGEETDDEMCIAFITYYPALSSAVMCNLVDDFGFCGNERPSVNEQCDIQGLVQEIMANTLSISLHCDSNGVVCKDQCKEAIDPVRNHPCLTASYAGWIRAILLQSGNFADEIMNQIYSCDEWPPMNIIDDIPVGDTGYCPDGPICEGETCAGEQHKVWNVTLLLCIVAYAFSGN